MIDTRFHAWKPALRADLYLRDDTGCDDVIMLGPRGGFIAAFPRRWSAILPRMDGARSVAELLVDDARASGRFDPRGLTDLLARLARLGALSEPPRRIPTAAAIPTVLDRLLRVLGRLLEINLTIPATAPWNPGRWTIPAAGLLVLAAHVLMLFLLLHGFIQGGDVGQAGGLNVAGAAFGGLVVAMTLRGLVRWYVLFAGGRPPRRVGLRIRLGLPFLDVDPRAAAHLSRRRQTALAVSGIAALFVAGGAMLLLPGGGPLAAAAGRAAMVALALDLCPFARSDASLLLESVLRIRWLRGRTLRYLRHGLLSRLLHGRPPSTEEWRLLMTVSLWTVWGGVAIPFFLFPVVRGALDVTGVLLTDALAAEDTFRSILGLAIGLGVALMFCILSVFGVLVAASTLLRSVKASIPAGTGVPAEPAPEALPEALKAAGLSGLDPSVLSASARWRRLGTTDLFPSPDHAFHGAALLVAGRAEVQRSEVSGLVHDVALAEPGWLIEGRAEKPSWRWNLRPRAAALILTLDRPPDGPLGELTGRISAYEDCPALWGLGPDGARWAASFPEAEVPGAAPVPSDPALVTVLLEGRVEHAAPEGPRTLNAPRVLPLPGPGEELRSSGAGIIVLQLPAPGPGSFLPGWWS